MAAPSDKALSAAIQLLAKQVADLPLAIALNVHKTADEALNEFSAKEQAAFVAAEEKSNREIDRKNRAAEAADAAGRPLAQLGAVATKAGSGLVKSAGAAGAAFGSLLGPLGTFATFLTASTSGFSTFKAASDLFANSVGQVFMPVFYSLSVGLVAASDVVQKKLAPAMDGLSKSVLNTAIPAMLAMADMAGRVTQAFLWIADSKLAKIATNDQGGTFGGVTRTLDRLAGNDLGPGAVGRGGNRPGENSGFLNVGALKSGIRGIDDAGRSVFGPGADAAIGLRDKLAKSIFGSEIDPYSGAGTNRGGGDPRKRTEEEERARRLAMQQLAFQLGGRGSAGGGVTDNWLKAQQSVLSLSPFEAESLRLQRESLAALMRAAAPEGPRSEAPDSPYASDGTSATERYFTRLRGSFGGGE